MKGRIASLQDLERIRDAFIAEEKGYRYQLLLCAGAGCVSSGCEKVYQAAEKTVEKLGLSGQVKLIRTGCIGTCAVGPVMLILPDKVFFTGLDEAATEKVLSSFLTDGKILTEHTFYDHEKNCHIPYLDEISFFSQQVRIALRNCGRIDYSDLSAYIAGGGYFAAARALCGGDPESVVATIEKSGLRGRGGAGFPTGIKLRSGKNADDSVKYLVCNADEGDPGAFMDRSIIEGDPHTLLEGMLLSGFAIGAKRGFVYVRAEYPLAIERLKAAIGQAEEAGLLGENILDSGFSFDIDIRIGAGAFVCGEETALLASIEGQRGEPRQKPPYPFQRGLYGHPTIINNVETLANIPVIMEKGSDWYRSVGTEEAPGTKVFALAGDIVNTGIIEVPIGMPIGDILFQIGGGVTPGKAFKAAQIGGPSGGCVTQDKLNTPADYKQLEKLGAIMGSGGLIAMDEDTCMVDTARYFMDFIRDESCGQCTACRVGTKRMLEILERITAGKGEEGDIDLLVELGEAVAEGSMCGLGQTAPNPVLSTIRYFRDEYEEHIKYHYCRAGVCQDLFVSPCENTCPANINIPGYLALIASGRFFDADLLIRRENPMPSVCGRVCTHPCEHKCRRGTLDEAVSICALKRFVADYAYANKTTHSDPVVKKNDRKVGVIGAGAAGLTCAYYLARKGYTVDVYEMNHVAGGVLAYGIPEYRLPSSVLRREIEEMQRSGFQLHLNTEVGKDIDFETLRKQTDAVFVAIGTQFPQKVNIPGEDLEGVIPGIEFLKEVKLYGNVRFDGKKVAVIGGGNTAVDAARTAIRLGASSVTILYRRTEAQMPAYREEVEEAVREGVKVKELVSPLRFIASEDDGKLCAIECMRRTLTNFDRQGRRNTVEIPESNFTFDVDVAIVAISQNADLPFIKKDDVSMTPWGTFIVDPDTQMTTIDGVFAGGDIVRGPHEVITAIADGKHAASAIDRYLGGNGELNKGPEIEIPVIKDDDDIDSIGRFPEDFLPLEKRTGSFAEVNLGFHKLNAMAEAMRCLHCDRR